jgi:hypothetical protein
MRFLEKTDEARFNLMVTEGVLGRDVIETAVGDQSVFLLDVLVSNADKVALMQWISWGVRQGLARLNRTKVTAAFVREFKLAHALGIQMHKAWFYPFARNQFGQTIVACPPGWPIPEWTSAAFGAEAVYCVATPEELRELRAAWAEAVPTAGLL